MNDSPHKYLLSAPRTSEFLASLRQREVIIYGAGKIGTRICQALLAAGIRPAAIWDRKAERIGAVSGIPVTNPTEPEIDRYRDAAVLVTVFSENVSRGIQDELRRAGMTDVIVRRSLLNAVLYLDCHQQVVDGSFQFDYETCHLCPVAKETNSRCDIYSRSVAGCAVGGSPAALPVEDRFVIPSLGVLVTNHCNLTCEGCNHLRDLYRPEDNVRIDPDTIIQDLQRVLEVVDLIEKVVVVGGEALVHNRIDAILERILELPRIGLVQIITNGTVIPKSPRLFEVLANRRLLVEISGYEAFLPEGLQENVRRFIELLERHGVQYKYVETLDWQDFGGFEHRAYSEKQHLRVYRTCCFVSNDLFDGKLFKCSRSVFATRLGRIPDYPQDYVDVRQTPLDQLRAKLVEFFANQYPQVCQHCDGTSTNRIAAGVQAPGTKNDPARARDGGPQIIPLSDLSAQLRPQAADSD